LPFILSHVLNAFSISHHSFSEQYLWLILNEIVSFPSTNLGGFKSVYETNFFYLIGRSFQNDEEWRLPYCNTILGCQLVQDFVLYK